MLNGFSFHKTTNSSLTKDLGEVNAEKEELEEKIRLLTLSLEEKQVLNVSEEVSEYLTTPRV